MIWFRMQGKRRLGKREGRQAGSPPRAGRRGDSVRSRKRPTGKGFDLTEKGRYFKGRRSCKIESAALRLMTSDCELKSYSSRVYGGAAPRKTLRGRPVKKKSRRVVTFQLSKKKKHDAKGEQVKSLA